MGWDIVLISDEAVDDSDKTITVIARYEYQILSIWIELATDATVGARQIEVQFRDAADDAWFGIIPGVTQAASLTYHYAIGPSLADHLGVRDAHYVMTPMPPTVFMEAGEDIRIWDNNAVAAAGDDMVVHVRVARRPV